MLSPKPLLAPLITTTFPSMFVLIGVSNEALKPCKLVTEFRIRLRISIRQINCCN